MARGWGNNDGEADALWRNTSDDVAHIFYSGHHNNIQWIGNRPEELLAVTGTGDAFGLIS